MATVCVRKLSRANLNSISGEIVKLWVDSTLIIIFIRTNTKKEKQKTQTIDTKRPVGVRSRFSYQPIAQNESEYWRTTLSTRHISASMLIVNRFRLHTTICNSNKIKRQSIFILLISNNNAICQWTKMHNTTATMLSCIHTDNDYNNVENSTISAERERCWIIRNKAPHYAATTTAANVKINDFPYLFRWLELLCVSIWLRFEPYHCVLAKNWSATSNSRCFS